MAGYVFAISGMADINVLSSIPLKGTLADYISMKTGDNIYFPCKRKYIME